MKRFLKCLAVSATLVLVGGMVATPAEAGGSFGFGFSYSTGHHRYHFGDYYCGPWYYPRAHFSYHYVYSPPPVVYYAPAPVYYAPPPPPAPRYYYRSGSFHCY